MMKRNILLFASIGILFTTIGAYFGAKQLEPETPGTRAITHLFAQSLADHQGKIQNMSQWKGKTLIVNFWAPWCAPCVEEMPELSALQAEVAKKNTQIIGIGIDSPSNILAFSAKYKIAYPLYIAGMSGTELPRAFGNQGGLPFTVIIGPDEQVKKTYLGRLKLDEVRRDLAAF